MKNHFLNSILWFLFLLFSINIFAQTEVYHKSGEAWLKSNYVEMVINKKGVFGGNTSNKPTTFHENRNGTNNLFGFIANPTRDNWQDYDGDYFTPRDAEEGFTISINGINYSNNNRIDPSQIPGSISEVSKSESECLETLATAIWQGAIENIDIKRSFIISETGLFIKMVTTLFNKSSEVKKKVYFSHNLDPDNNYTINGNFSTVLKIVSQPSALNNIAMVKASQNGNATPQDKDGSVVSFFADDSRARVTYGGFANRNASDIWNGLFLQSNVNETSDLDVAMSIAFNLGDIDPGETKEFTYYYILEDVNIFFSPLIIDSSYKNPSDCNASDGQIILSGFLPSENYNIEYQKDGIKIPNQSFTSNSNGNITFVNLKVGKYSNFTISSVGCKTILNNTIVLDAPYDKKDCKKDSVKKLVLKYPLFFTPNNDGVNDYWQIDDIKSLVNPVVHIMDRYGKLLKTLQPQDKGWDGTYNGRKVLSNDYWFIIYYDNEFGNREKQNGNFSLIR